MHLLILKHYDHKIALTIDSIGKTFFLIVFTFFRQFFFGLLLFLNEEKDSYWYVQLLVRYRYGPVTLLSNY